MKATNNQKFYNAIREVESALVNKNYLKIGSESRASKLSSSDIENILKEYGGVVTPAPDDSIKSLEIISVKNTNPQEYVTDFDLYIDGELSDLTITLTLKSSKDGAIVALVDNLHIL